MNGEDLDQDQLISTVDREKNLNISYKSKPKLQEIDKFYITEDPIEEEKWSKIP